jgi:AcrR family transcriptional regulator
MRVHKVDRRIRHTKQALRDSLIKLLKHKPIEKISVKELCEDADINRSTFYAHYQDPADLMAQIERELFRNLNEYLDGYHVKEDEAETFRKIVMIVEYVRENAELCSTLINENGDFQKEIMVLLQNQLRDWQGVGIEADEVDYMLTFSITGSLGIFRKWLQEGLDKSPREIAEMVMRFTYRRQGSIDN